MLDNGPMIGSVAAGSKFSIFFEKGIGGGIACGIRSSSVIFELKHHSIRLFLEIQSALPTKINIALIGTSSLLRHTTSSEIISAFVTQAAVNEKRDDWIRVFQNFVLQGYGVH